MKSFRTKKWLKGLMLAMLLIVGSTVFSASVKEVQAATAGFKTIAGKTYYIKSDGSKKKGWLTLGGYKYYFNTKTGVQVKGWMKVNGKYTYYFTKGKGVMTTGWMTDSKGHKRYFNPKTGKLTTGWVNCSKGRKRYFTKGGGIMATGWLTNSKGQKRYFYKTSGYMATKWVKNKSKNISYYFATSTGYMYTGLKTIDQKNYYFKSNGVMAVSTSVTVNGITYSIAADGVATAKTTKPNVNVSNGNVKVYDTKTADITLW